MIKYIWCVYYIVFHRGLNVVFRVYVVYAGSIDD